MYQPVAQDDQQDNPTLTCPQLRALGAGDSVPVLLPLMKLQVTIDVHIAKAFVFMEATFHNATGRDVDCMFQVPMHIRNVVTSASVEIGERIFETQVIESSLLEQQQSAAGGAAGASAAGADAAKAKEDEGIKKAGSRFASRYDEYNPEIFQLPFHGFAAGEQAVVRLHYFEDLSYADGRYEIKVPMRIPQGMGMGGELNEVLGVHCAINAGTPDCNWGCASHRMNVLHQEVSRIVLQTDNTCQWKNADFVINYFAHTNTFLNHLIVEQPKIKPAETPDDQWDPRGSFALFMAPPQAEHLPKFFGRNVVFLLDRSGSMAGSTIRRAAEALVTGLQQLQEDDVFWICAFDHDQLWFSLTASGQVRGVEGPQPPTGVPGSASNVQSAVNWVRQIDVRGLTDIMTPVVSSVSILRSIYDRQHAITVRSEPGSVPPPSMPIIVLVTDGAVADERQICQYMRQNGGPVRCFTCGIGPFCNRYFLRMLAQLGRGYSEMALKTTDITAQMTSLMAKTCNPVLADITLAISQLESCELYPFPIPDLYGAAPIVLAGKFSGAFPPTITVRGRLGNGAMYEEVVQAYYTQYVPISKVFVKLRLDLLVATAWLASGKEAEELRANAVKLSVNESMPCPYTSTVVYETNSQRRDEFGGSPKGTSATALALGGVVALGTVFGVMHAFGSTGATLGNISAGDGMASLFGDGLSSLGDAFAGVGDAAGSLEGCCSLHENALDGCFGDCGGCMGNCAETAGESCGQAFHGCVNCPAHMGAACGDCVGSCGADPVGAVSHCCGDVCGEVSALADPVGHCCSGATGAAGECVGSCTRDYSSFLSEGLACGGGCDGLGEGLGDACEASGSVIEGCCEGAGDLLGCLGDALGSLDGLDC